MSTLDWLTWIGDGIAAALAITALIVSWSVRREREPDPVRLAETRRRIMERSPDE